nr:response regulator transcription factor [Spirochaetia bacterium]
EVTGAGDGITALKKFRETEFDLILLDFMMPGIDGIDVIRRIREDSAVPIIMVTARAEENDKLMGLEIGADDYIVKPFSLKELAARIRAVLRRSGNDGELNSNSSEIIKYSNLEMNTVKRSLTRDTVAIDLTMVQFELLKAMLHSPGRVFTRADLLGVLQEASYESYERTIDVHIKNIRKAIEPVPSEPRYILTVWGVGYKLAEDQKNQ